MCTNNVQLYIVNARVFVVVAAAFHLPYTIYLYITLIYYGRVSDLNFITQSFYFRWCLQLALAQRWVKCTLCVALGVCNMHGMHDSFENIHCNALTLHSVHCTCTLCVYCWFLLLSRLTFFEFFNHECTKWMRALKYSRKFLALSLSHSFLPIEGIRGIPCPIGISNISFWTRYTVSFNWQAQLQYALIS